MKSFLEKFDRLQRIEFWGATGIFCLVLFIRFAIRDGDLSYELSFVPSAWRAILFYLAFLLLNFKIVPDIFIKQNVLLNSFYVLILLVFVTWVNDMIHDYVISTLEMTGASRESFYNTIHHPFAIVLWAMGVFTGYTIIKYGGRYLLSDPEDAQSVRYITIRDSFTVFVLWLVLLLLLALAGAHDDLIIAWVVMIPTAIVVYNYSFRAAIPKALPKKYPFFSYLIKMFFFSAVIGIGVSLFTVTVSDDEAFSVGLGFFDFMFQIFVSVPLSWLLFQRYKKSNEQLHTLKKELGQSEASFDFLRSQINPHFLFNALNTIYGTAIQEKAERTGEGVLKLADMMRFMLQENMQEKISLSREIEYLNNYISLQKLRTDSNPIVHIQTNVEEVKRSYQIAPMLLIPFVENAFKHGISLREASYINVALEIKDKTLYFDVHNSKHAKSDSDPEKDKSGIGLNNVKQRLQLLYDGKHDLMIRETGKDFFVHLTLQLS